MHLNRRLVAGRESIKLRDARDSEWIYYWAAYSPSFNYTTIADHVVWASDVRVISETPSSALFIDPMPRTSRQRRTLSTLFAPPLIKSCCDDGTRSSRFVFRERLVQCAYVRMRACVHTCYGRILRAISPRDWKRSSLAQRKRSRQ